jgi:putative endonuclease
MSKKRPLKRKRKRLPRKRRRKRKKNPPNSSMIDRQELGRRGENLVVEFLVQRGMKLIARNLRLAGGEIDLLLQEGETVVVVEVKTQTKASFSHPIFQIHPRKALTLRRLGAAIANRYPNQNVRLDAATVYWCNDQTEPVITYYPNILA